MTDLELNSFIVRIGKELEDNLNIFELLIFATKINSALFYTLHNQANMELDDFLDTMKKSMEVVLALCNENEMEEAYSVH